MFLRPPLGILTQFLHNFISKIYSMFLREFTPWVRLSLLESASGSLHLFLFAPGEEGVLSWRLFLSDSLFSSHSWGIAPALCFGRITVERSLLLCIFLLVSYWFGSGLHTVTSVDIREYLNRFAIFSGFFFFFFFCIIFTL